MTGCQSTNEAKPVGGFDTVAEAIHRAPIIVKANFTGSAEKYVFDGIDFTLSEVEISEILRGENLVLDKKIQILQAVTGYEAKLNRSSEMMLFIEVYTGPVIDKLVYTMPYDEYSKFIVSGQKLKVSVKGDSEQDRKYIEDAKKYITIDDFITLIRNTPYEPYIAPQQ